MHHHVTPSTIGPHKQQGIVLFVSLVLLLLLTIISVSAVQTTSLEERMSRNARDEALAFQAAESALRDAEDFIETVVSTVAFNDAGANGLWTVAPFGDVDRWTDAGVWDGGTSVEAPTAIQGVAEQPRYIVEHVATVLRDENAYLISDPYVGNASDRVEIFRVTARGVGGSENANVLLQTTYGRILE
jgi:type IV pilus assembly protein PilX